MFNKKSTRKAALIVLAIILFVSIISVVIPKISANTAKNDVSEIVISTENTDATETTEETTTTEATEATVEETTPVEKPVRNNEQSNNNQPSNEPTQPETEKPTEPAPTEPKPTEPAPTEPSEPETEPTVPETEPEKPTEHVHAYQVSKVVKATCTTSGYTTYVCACGHAYNGDTTAPVEHEYNVEVVAPTVDSEGYTLHTCKTCGKTQITDKTDKLPAPQTAPESKPAEHRHAEIVQGGVTYVFCTDITVPYAEPGYVYYPWSYYPF